MTEHMHKTQYGLIAVLFPKSQSIVFLQPFLCFPAMAKEWALLRVWDALEFEDEHSESTSMSLEGTGDFSLEQSRKVL